MSSNHLFHLFRYWNYSLYQIIRLILCPRISRCHCSLPYILIFVYFAQTNRVYSVDALSLHIISVC